MSIKKDLTHGIFWIAISKYSGIAVSLVISAILARLIEPSQFGIIAIATVLISFLSIFSDFGMGTAAIQSNKLDDKDYDHLFTLTLYIGTFLSLTAFFSSWWFADLYRDPKLVGVIQLMSVILFMNSINTLPNALIYKHKKFKIVALRSLAIQVLSGIIGVAMAMRGYEVYALITASLIASAGTFLCNYYYYPRKFTFWVNKVSVKKIFKFSIFQFLFMVLNYFSRNADKLIVGKYFDMKALGYYDKSYRLMLMPLENLTQVINPVIVPVLSQLQDNDEELAKKQESMLGFIAMISFPLGIFLHFVARETIVIYFGEQWQAAAPVFSILSLSIPLQMILSTSGSYYQCAGKTNYMFYNGILNTTCTVLGFIVAAIYGSSIEAIAWAWVLTLTLNFITSYYVMYKFVFKRKMTHFYRVFLKPLGSTAFLLASLALLSIFVKETSLWVSLLIKSAAAFLITFTLIQATGQYNIISFLKTLRKKTQTHSH